MDLMASLAAFLSDIQLNLAILNSVNSKSPLFRRKIECPWIYPSPLRFPGYFEAPLFRTFFSFPLGLRTIIWYSTIHCKLPNVYRKS